jgi:nucleoside-diphosphate kinase
MTQVGDIGSRFEKKGFVLKGMKMFQCPKEVAEEHYEDLSEKPFFGDLVDYIVSGPVMCMVWEGPGAVKACRLRPTRWFPIPAPSAATSPSRWAAT